jgi:hypothetical protein
MSKPSLWEFRGEFDEDGEIEFLEIREVLELPIEWEYVLFLQEQNEQYIKGFEILAGMG